MWGFGLGVLGLVALQTLVQPAAANKLASGSGALVSILTRMLSPAVAGIPQTKASKSAAANAAQAAATSAKTASETAKAASDAAKAGLVPQSVGGIPTGAPPANATPEQLQQWAAGMFNG